MQLSLRTRSYFMLFFSSLLVSIGAGILAYTLKILTEHAESFFYQYAQNHKIMYVFLPTIGITAIYFIRKWFFKGKKNRGIKEIYGTLNDRKKSLAWFKIPSHYINGFLTVAFGGSTGIEVSTVVATAALGNNAQGVMKVAKKHREALICSAIASGIAVLFGSPIAGGLFAIEVIARKRSVSTWTMVIISMAISGFMISQLEQEFLFSGEVLLWKWQALPFFLLVSILAAFSGVYFTKSVLYLKKRLGAIENNFVRVNSGAITLGLLILVLPQLYGDSYHAVFHFLEYQAKEQSIFNMVLVLIGCIALKPLAASLTLGAGGDGGVFAPSLVTGACIGLLVAFVANELLGMQLIPLNFAILGAATMLSAAIHAPFTALFLACSLVDGGYILFIPLALSVFISKYLAAQICNYTVYTYKEI